MQLLPAGWQVASRFHRRRPHPHGGTKVAFARVVNVEVAMSDDPKQTGKPDDARINIEQEHEVSYWSKKLGVSREELRSAVDRAGPLVKYVRQQLNK
jgi:hypothetical protein